MRAISGLNVMLFLIFLAYQKNIGGPTESEGQITCSEAHFCLFQLFVGACGESVKCMLDVGDM